MLVTELDIQMYMCQKMVVLKRDDLLVVAHGFY